jgi:hypothetical protein
MSVDICDLAKTPQKYDGQMVALRAAIFKGWLRPGQTIKEFILTESSSSISCPGIHILVVVPASTRPKPNFDLELDDSFKAFENALHERTAIEGTFQGRFDLERGKYPLRLIIMKVSELSIQHTGHVDR